jgi:biotin carboxyl carrier protein
MNACDAYAKFSKSMSDGTFLNIKRPITVRAVVTPTWKEEAERELSNGIATADQQLAQLEQEGQKVVDEVRRQSANPLDPRVQEQVGQIQQQVGAKRAELEEQKRNLLQQQAQVRELATHDIFMPALSSTMTEGKIVEWLKQPGEKVARGESVLVVESDKADMDVESFQDGFLAAVLMPAGSTAPVGETIGLIVETEAEIADAKANAPAAPAAAS